MGARPWAQGQGTVQQEGRGQLRVPWCHTLIGGPCRSGPQPFPATSCPLSTPHPGFLWPGSPSSHPPAPSHCPPRANLRSFRSLATSPPQA